MWSKIAMTMQHWLNVSIHEAFVMSYSVYHFMVKHKMTSSNKFVKHMRYIFEHSDNNLFSLAYDEVSRLFGLDNIENIITKWLANKNNITQLKNVLKMKSVKMYDGNETRIIKLRKHFVKNGLKSENQGDCYVYNNLLREIVNYLQMYNMMLYLIN